MRLLFGLAALLLLVTLVVAKREDLCEYPKDAKLKQRQIINIISTINKPISPIYRESRDVLTEYQLQGLGILPKTEVFSLFDERYWNETIHVLELLFEAHDFDDFIKRSEVIRLRVNEELFFYAFNVAVLHRSDTQGLQLPRIHKVFPDKFLKESVMRKMIETNQKAKYIGKSPIIDTAGDLYNHLDMNSELNYFTEDVGLNSHHYHWHVLNPAIWLEEFGGKKDRKGELFYWMHQQMVARYDIERMCNHLPRVKALWNLNEEIEEGYEPHLTMVKTQYHYAFRPPHSTLHDLPDFPKSKMFEWARRILDGIHKGFFIHKNHTMVKLDEKNGINLIGNAIEANLDSVNCHLYGNLHCFAHMLAASVTDPLGTFGETHGAMYDVATSARDPLFYRWHKYINHFFEQHKKMLTPYTHDDLEWSDVHVNGISVQGRGSGPNEIRTYWQRTLSQIPKGFEYTKEYPAKVAYTHLQHENFDYVIEIENRARTAKLGLVRIFIAPVYNELGRKFTINEQRLLVIQMDKFKVRLSPGRNTIRRNADNSTVTMTSKNIFAPITQLKDEDHCRCGWPDYLLVPRGDFNGKKFRLFVIVTDFEKDFVPVSGSCMCRDGLGYCGGINTKYPDRRAMGFPFDRKIHHFNWDEFETDNMARTKISIRFTNEFMPPRDYDDHQFR